MGNVRVTFSDIKIPTGSGSQPFTVDLLSKSEYYPYGMKINDLSYNATGARYGYNGTHEQDLEVNADGNYLDFGDFGYDTRVAMRRNIDPMFAAYPHLSGYATFNNNQISYADPTGWEPCIDCDTPLIPHYDGGGKNSFPTDATSVVPPSGKGEFKTNEALLVNGNMLLDGAKYLAKGIADHTYVGVQSFGSWSNLGSPKPYEVKIRKIDGSETTGKEVAVSTVETMLMFTPLPKVGRISQYFSMPGTNAVLRPVKAEVVGYKTFAAFKKANGSAGKDMAWNHIVEQYAVNIEKFGAVNIHNLNNLIKLPHGKGSIHAKITGHYNSIQPFTGGKRVRDWLKTQSFQQQYDYGISILKKYGINF